MPKHKNKHIQAAIKYALEKGWRLETASPHAHIWGQLFCPHAQRGGCIVRVFSTPRSNENHARDIRRRVDNCSHQ